jgi:DNA repair protein
VVAKRLFFLSIAHPNDYDLMTRTDAKAEFLLKDCDFDFREPPLKFVLKKNPHNNRWGDMKLYLKFQCRDRAMIVHESEENLEDKREMRVVNLHKTRQKTYEKKIKGRFYLIDIFENSEIVFFLRITKTNTSVY